MSDFQSTDRGEVAARGDAATRLKRWTAPRVILSEMVLQNVGAPVNPGVVPTDVKGATTNSGDGS